MKRLLIAAMFALAACNGCGAKSNVPPALAQYNAPQWEVRPFDAYAIPGVRLYRVVEVGVMDKSTTFVVGVDDAGKKVEGFDLVKRSGDRPAKDLAERVVAFMLDGGAIVGPDSVSGGFPYPEAEKALVKPPVNEDGKLTFWMSQGDMHPTLVRFVLDLATGKMERTAASELVAR